MIRVDYLILSWNKHGNAKTMVIPIIIISHLRSWRWHPRFRCVFAPRHRFSVVPDAQAPYLKHNWWFLKSFWSPKSPWVSILKCSSLTWMIWGRPPILGKFFVLNIQFHEFHQTKSTQFSKTMFHAFFFWTIVYVFFLAVFAPFLGKFERSTVGVWQNGWGWSSLGMDQ